jgi:hypothetical protein
MVVTLLTVVLTLLSSVQGMLIVFKARDHARIGKIRALTDQIARDRANQDELSLNQSAPVRDPVPPPPQAAQPVQEPSPATAGVGDGASPRTREGLHHLTDLANFMAKRRVAAVVEWKGKLAILYQRVEPEGSEAFWEIMNVLSDLKLLGSVRVLAADDVEAEQAKRLRRALVEFGVPEDRIQVGTRHSPGEVLTGVLLTTAADS